MKKLILLPFAVAFLLQIPNLITAQPKLDEKVVLEKAAPKKVVVEANADVKAGLSKKSIEKIEYSNIMYLNAFNLNFGDAKLSSNYVGMLNLFAPNISDKKWGFNTGIMKINYAQDSGTSDITVLENVMMKPLDVPVDGYKYLKQINRYKIEKKNTVWSFYVQPLYELTTRISKQHVYINGHFELLASKWSQMSSTEKLFQDTGIYSIQKPVVLKANLPYSGSIAKTSLSGYIGLGITFDLLPWESGNFFFQATVGKTTNSVGSQSVDINTPIIPGPKNPVSREWTSFYLIRSQYKHALSEASTLVVGVDIRGILPEYSPQYAAFVGLNLKLEKLTELVGFKNEKETAVAK